MCLFWGDPSRCYERTVRECLFDNSEIGGLGSNVAARISVQSNQKMQKCAVTDVGEVAINVRIVA